MPASEPTYAQKRAILDSYGGRLLGWNVRLRGERVCSLAYAGYADMFWDEYLMADVSADHDLESQNFWDTHAADLRFESAAWPELVAPSAFGVCNPQARRLLVRGLYLDPRLTPFERLRYFLGL